jgi:hypothetical protein
MLAEVSRKNDRSRAFSAESHTYFSKHPVLRIVRNHRESYPVRPSRRSDLRKIMRCYLSGDYEGEESPPHPGFTRT